MIHLLQLWKLTNFDLNFLGLGPLGDIKSPLGSFAKPLEASSHFTLPDSLSITFTFRPFCVPSGLCGLVT